MGDFLSTFVFILPGIMAYFWLQAFGINPSTKHSAAEFTGIASLLWLPVSFITLLLLNVWGKLVKVNILSVETVWTLESLNHATTDIRYLLLFLCLSFIVSFVVCWFWSSWGNELLRNKINYVRKSRKIAPLSSSASVWEEFFIRIDEQTDVSKETKNDRDEEKRIVGKTAVYIIHKIDNPEKFIAGSMTKASRPLESDKSLVLEDTQEWHDSIRNDYDFKIKRTYVDIKTGMVVKEIDHENPIPKPFPKTVIH